MHKTLHLYAVLLCLTTVVRDWIGNMVHASLFARVGLHRLMKTRAPLRLRWKRHY